MKKGVRSFNVVVDFLLTAPLGSNGGKEFMLNF